MKRRFNELISYMQEFQNEWKSISEYMNPVRGKFDDSEPKYREIDYTKYVNSTAAQGLDILSSGLQAGVASPNRPWFNFFILPVTNSSTKAGEINSNNIVTAEKQYLSDARNRVENIFANSNTYQSLRLLFEEAATFGTGVMIVDENDNETIHCTTLTAGEYALANGSDGRADTLCRYIYKTTADLVRDFGYNELPDNIKEQYDNGRFDEWHKVCHMITPNLDIKTDSAGGRGKKISSLYWLDEGNVENFLKEEGYDRNPIIALRWSRVTTSDIYGIGIGSRILGDLKQLTKLEKDKCLLVDLMAFPPMQVNAMVQGEINLNPKGIIRYVGNEPAVNPVDRNPKDLNGILTSIDVIERRIFAAFYRDIFVMIMQATREKTAYEVDALLSEKMLMIGPLYENIKYEVLLPLLSNALNIAISKGKVGEPPESIGDTIDIEFHTMVSQAQKASSLTNQNTFMSLLINYSQNGFQEALDNVNIDNVLINSGEKLGVDMQLFRKHDEVEQIRNQRVQAAQSNQQLDMLQKTANVTKTNNEAQAIAEGGLPE